MQVWSTSASTGSGSASIDVRSVLAQAAGAAGRFAVDALDQRDAIGAERISHLLQRVGDGGVQGR
jgi:hypothetical protein